MSIQRKKIVSIEELREARERAQAPAVESGGGAEAVAAEAVAAETTETGETAEDRPQVVDDEVGSGEEMAQAPISAEEIQRLADQLRDELGDEPGIRMDKVVEAKMRISLGYYTGERITRGLLDSLNGQDHDPGEGPPLPAGKDGESGTQG